MLKVFHLANHFIRSVITAVVFLSAAILLTLTPHPWTGDVLELFVSDMYRRDVDPTRAFSWMHLSAIGVGMLVAGIVMGVRLIMRLRESKLP